MRTTIGLLLLVSPAFGARILRDGAAIPFAETCAGLQSALNAARGGDIVELRAGTNAGVPYYRCGTGTVQVPSHPGAGFVTVRTERFRNLPDGETRVCPPGSLAERLGCAANVRPDDLAVIQFEPNFVTGFQAAPGAGRWRFAGLEIRGESTVLWSTLFSLGVAGPVRDRAYAFEIDRCWLHGYYDRPGPQKAIDADGSAITVKNSVIEEFKASGQDGQGIYTRSGPGPLTVTNNFLAGGAENFFTAGAATRWPGTVPGLVTFAGNLSTRDPRWWRSSAAADPAGPCTPDRFHRNTVTSAWWQCAGGAWQQYPCGAAGQPACPRTDVYTTLKNLFEFKAVKTARIEGNVFDRHWVAAQGGAILMINTSTHQNGYTFTLDDVDFRFNRISRTPTAFGAGAATSDPYRPPSRLTIAHNILDAVLDPESNTGSRYLFMGFPNFAVHGYTIRNNTVVNSIRSGNAFGLYATPAGREHCPYCQFLDNVLPWNAQPITADGGPNAAVFFGTSGYYSWPHGRAAGNVFSLNGRNPLQHYRDALLNPPCCGGNAIAGAEEDVLDTGWRIKAPYQGMSTDGGDPGADIDTVKALTSGAVSGAANPYLRFRIGSWAATETGATIYYDAPAASSKPEGACAIRVSRADGPDPEGGEISETGSGMARMATASGLQPGAAYHFAITCGTGTRRGSFRTRLSGGGD